VLDRVQVVGLLKEQCEIAGSQVKLAEKMHIAPQYLNNVMRGRHVPGHAIYTYLGLKRKVFFVHADLE